MTEPAAHCALAVLLLLAAPAVAHHSPAMFDMSRDIVLEGTIRDFSWRNPHVYIELDVAGPNGQPVSRRIEAGPASNFVPLGIDGDSLRAGERVVVQAKPNRGGAARTALGWLLMKADGTVIPLHVRAIPPTQPGAAQASGLAGTWVPQGIGFAELAVAARGWPLTETGRAAVEATREARNASRSQCVPFGPPALMTLPSTVIVEQSDTAVVFRLDVMDAERVVNLGRAEHPAQLEPSLHGHSIGHWDGDTLVVDTVGYAAHPDGYAFDRPSSATKHVVERFTLSADRRHLDYEAVVEDPEYLAEPVTHRAQWDYRPEQAPSNLPCDPEVAAQFTEDE
ncbi:MAG TPA: DUF6152 family protein [Gammaproteobacteria bacterium]|nr:DUF6152 family protein [Gammaproteobacteria bacterium]